MGSKKFSARVGRTTALAGFLLLAACGGSDGGPPPVVTAPVPPSPEPSPTPQPAPQPAPEVIALAATYSEIVASSTNGQINWPDGSGTGSAIGGVNCMGTIVSHSHSLVSIYRDGVRLALPERIGLMGCTYELHTHDRSGTVHVEPNVARPLTLGNFFGVWGQPISRTAVAGLAGPVRYYLIENEVISRFDGNPADIALGGHKEVIIVTGTAPAVVPKYRWPADL